MTKKQQYNDYLNWGGTMTIEEWERDGRYDKSADPTYNDAPAYTKADMCAFAEFVMKADHEQLTKDAGCFLYYKDVLAIWEQNKTSFDLDTESVFKCDS
jgi:hypothetical protein